MCDVDIFESPSRICVTIIYPHYTILALQAISRYQEISDIMNVDPNVKPVRLDSQIVSISHGKSWKGAVVKALKKDKQVYFGHIGLDVEMEEGDDVYITAQPLIMENEAEDKKMHVILYTSDGTKADWTII